MASEAQRLIGISLNKIAQSRSHRGGVSLHKNLLVATVLQKARYIFMEEAYNMVHYQVQAPSAALPGVQQSRTPSVVEDDLVGLTAEEAGIEPMHAAEDVHQEASSTHSTSLPDFLQPCTRTTQDKENQPPTYHPSSSSASEVTYLDLDKNSSVLRERSNSGGLKRRRAIAEWETEEAVQSILPKRFKNGSSDEDEDEEDSVFLDDASTALSETVSKELITEGGSNASSSSSTCSSALSSTTTTTTTTTTTSTSSGSAMEIDRITSLVSIFNFGMSEGGKLSRSVSTPDLCSSQAKDTDDALQQRPFLAMTV